jgi:hypothetical protein
MKPEIYYENKKDRIAKLSVLVNLSIPRAAKYGGKDLNILRGHVLDFIAMTPDVTDDYTDTTWVACWKTTYARISDAIRDIKEIGDYRLDQKRKELATVANSLLPPRRAVFWID